MVVGCWLLVIGYWLFPPPLPTLGGETPPLHAHCLKTSHSSHSSHSSPRQNQNYFPPKWSRVYQYLLHLPSISKRNFIDLV